jgi:hypothetical protein
MNMDKTKPQSGAVQADVLLLSGLALLIGSYALLRYGGWWSESDTQAFIRATTTVLQTGALAPAGQAYQNGYGYQVLVIWLATLTGLPLGLLQLITGALLAVWVVFPAWLCYREFTHSRLASSLAILVLLAQPEFVFPLLRGTHEKFTRGLMFLCLYLLLRSLRERVPRRIALLLVGFYLCAYALIAFNTFMATSFILAVILALALLLLVSWCLAPAGGPARPLVTKLLYVAFSSFVIASIFIFYIYPPAQDQLRVLQNMADRLALLFLQVEGAALNPYTVVNSGWISLQVYFVLSLANWLLLAFSLFLWLGQSYRWLIHRAALPARHELALWAFYAAFAFLGFSSILVDVSGALSANLQHRIYPSFAMLAAPLAGAWLAERAVFASASPRWRHAAVGLLLAILIGLSVLKATAEPLLSNYWVFYTPAEQASLVWAEQALRGRSLWTDPIGRVGAGYVIQTGREPVHITLDSYRPDRSTRDYLLSQTTLLHQLRLGQSLPVQADSLVTYDNGQAQIYHRRPLTPFQK